MEKKKNEKNTKREKKLQGEAEKCSKCDANTKKKGHACDLN